MKFGLLIGMMRIQTTYPWKDPVCLSSLLIRLLDTCAQWNCASDSCALFQ